jgi:H+-transporting ATPase
MADRQTESSSSTPDHLRTTIPTGQLNRGEKAQYHEEKYREKEPESAAPEEEDEDIDQLIQELESEDGEAEEEEETGPGMSAKPIPEELLNTDTRTGLTSHEVTERRKKYGLNQMAEEKENLIKKFLMYFVGPIQFVMEVRPLTIVR